jgi:hypothetical protein
MATIKSRINISVPEEVKHALVQLAKRDQIPAATKAEHLLEIGLELEEDQAWDQIAAKRDTKNARFHTHAQVFDA